MSTSSQNAIGCPVCKRLNVAWFATCHDVEYRTTEEPFDYWQCADCHSVYLPNPPADRLSQIYPPHYYAYGSSNQQGLLERVKAALDRRMIRGLLRQIPGRDMRVLDAGGGWGWLLSAARDTSPRVSETHIVDIDERPRSAAEAAGHVYHQSRIEEFDSQHKFDLILLLNLLEHVADPQAVMSKMRTLLSPRGLMVVKTPNVETWDQRLFRHREWGGFHCPRHFVLFTAEGLRSLALNCGLAPLRIKFTQGAPQWTASLLAYFARRGWIRPAEKTPLLKHPMAAPLLAATAAFDFLRLPFAKTAQMVLTCKAAPDLSSSEFHHVKRQNSKAQNAASNACIS